MRTPREGNIRTRPTARRSQWNAGKRALDLACIVIALPVLLPVLGLLSLLLKCLSRGPLLFKQERMGLGQRPFICFKFRTMKHNADPGTHREHVLQLARSGLPMTKLDSKGDPRLIPGGGFLRAIGLDELPQLLNVWRGEMSLVGPRPAVRYEHETFTAYQRRRCETLPGLTGLWQVSGKNQTTFQRMIELDIFYAENRSLWLDVLILARTFPALIKQVLHRDAGRSSSEDRAKPKRRRMEHRRHHRPSAPPQNVPTQVH